MPNILMKRLGVLFVASGVITMLVGVFLWTFMGPTLNAILTLMIFLVVGGGIAIIGIFMIVYWYHSTVEIQMSDL